MAGLLNRWRLGLAERAVTFLMRRLLPYGLSAEPVNLERLPPPRPDGRYALYLHVPFCETLCPYCSFHRIPFRPAIADQYFDDLEHEMRLAAELGFRCDTLYIGGGTPTVMVDRLLGVLALARELFGIKHASCESHAHHLRPDIAGRLAGHVERLSIGVQSLDPAILRRMRRDSELCPPEAILAAIRAMNDSFPTLNVDLIFNLPGQSAQRLVDDLDALLDTGVRQVTVYPLMSSPGMTRDMRRQLGGATGSREYEMYHRIESRMQQAGMRASSPWCYSRATTGMIDEYIVDAPEYLGLGSGAFSLLDNGLYVNTFSVTRYSEHIRAGRMSVERMRRFQPWELMHYRLMMGLFGLDLDRVGVCLADDRPSRALLACELFLLRCAGAFESAGTARHSLSHAGRYLSLAMMREFFAGMNQVRDESRAALPAWQRGVLCEGAPDWPGSRPACAGQEA